MINTNKTVDDLLIRINSSTVWAFCYFLKDRLNNQGVDVIAADYAEGNVKENELIRTINKSKKFSFLKWMFPGIIMLIHSESFTDNVVDVCLDYPMPWRDTLLELIAHKNLSINSLQRINEVMNTPEAFYKLLIHYLSDNGEVKGFISFLDANRRFINEFKNNGQDILKRYTTDNNDVKINAIKSWASL